MIVFTKVKVFFIGVIVQARQKGNTHTHRRARTAAVLLREGGLLLL